jgi:excisionase family DNA binding protein
MNEAHRRILDAISRALGTMGSEEEVFTISEFSKHLRLHPKTIYGLLRQGKIPGFRVRNSWRLDRTIIQEWMRLAAPAAERALPSSNKEDQKPPQPKTVRQKPKKAVRCSKQTSKERHH